ncbi:MAG TPA: 3-phosphoshikimate 1-carboxyvinyltransferase [Pyrinomonadaceae bacterium]|nr:3-phosphoshikimate 1-carboxyvinyltransferase [Pyrinomonadaceae bacterium]
MKIHPANAIKGSLDLPGDKSISHRAAMLASIATGTSRITNFLTAEDCLSTLGCMRQLGVKTTRAGATVEIEGVGKHGLLASSEPLDCGNSGTTARLITGLLAGQRFETTLIGDASLSKRPMNRVTRPLKALGAEMQATDGKLPVTISGTPLNAANIPLEVASAQVKSCLLLAGLYAGGKTTVVEPVQTRDHTERMLEWLGADISIEIRDNARHITVDGGSELTARDISVPADISSAAFMLVAAACLEGSRLVLPNVGLNPTRKGVLDVLRRCGVRVQVENEREASGEPVGDLVIDGGIGNQELSLLAGPLIPNIIDEIPIIAVFGTQLPNGIEIRDAHELRVKETDRIKAIVEDLRRMDVKVDEFDDGFRVYPGRPKGASIESFGDHRIAMAFAVAGLFADGETTIEGHEACEISFPSFFDALDSVVP